MVTEQTGIRQAIHSPYHAATRIQPPQVGQPEEPQDMADILGSGHGIALFPYHPPKSNTVVYALAAAVVGLSALLLTGCDEIPDPVATSSMPTTQASFKKFDVDHAAMVRSPSGNHNIIATKDALEVDGQVVKDGNNPLQIASSSEDRIAANIQDNGQYIVYSTEGVVVNGQWVTANGQRILSHPSDGGGAYSVGMNSSGHWIASSQRGVIVDGKLATQNGTPIDVADSDGHTSSEMLDNGTWSVVGSKGLVSGQIK